MGAIINNLLIVVNWNVFWTVFNLILLFVLLRVFLWKPVLAIMEKRKQTIQGDLDDAAAKNAEADELKARYESSLSAAKQESAQIVADAHTRAQAQYDEIVGKAGADASAILEKAEKTAEAERAQAVKDAQSEIADLALAAASRLLGANVDAEANRKLLDDFLAEAGEA